MKENVFQRNTLLLKSRKAKLKVLFLKENEYLKNLNFTYKEYNKIGKFVNWSFLNNFESVLEILKNLEISARKYFLFLNMEKKIKERI